MKQLKPFTTRNLTQLNSTQLNSTGPHTFTVHSVLSKHVIVGTKSLAVVLICVGNLIVHAEGVLKRSGGTDIWPWEEGSDSMVRGLAICTVLCD
jgi:hypothetical protein